MTADEIKNEVKRLVSGTGGSEISVVAVRYKGTGHSSRADKSIYVLTAIDANGDQRTVLVGDRGKTGPALIKIGGADDAKKFSGNAFFSLHNAGYPKSGVIKTPMEFTRPADLWIDCFGQHHSDNPLAQRAFLILCGVDVNETGAFEAAVEKAGMKVKPKDAPVENPYGGNPLWGAL
jgi:hypothetical protein